MRINNSGNLSVEYFHTYFRLVINTQNIGKKEARNLIFKRFFHDDPMLRGKTTYTNFEKAYDTFNY